MEEWESRARLVLAEGGDGEGEGAGAGAGVGEDAGAGRQYSTLGELRALLAEGDDIEAALPSQHALHAALQHAADWLAKVLAPPPNSSNVTSHGPAFPSAGLPKLQREHNSRVVVAILVANTDNATMRLKCRTV